MKAIIRIVIAALVVHATWRAATVYLRYYEFKDAVHEAAQFSGSRPDGELHNRILELAREGQVPLAAKGLSVKRVDNHTVVEATYTDDIELLPSYRYPWDFHVNVDTFTIVPKEAR